MACFTPKFITFNCCGTLTNCDMAAAATQIYASQMTRTELDAFLFSFRGHCLDCTPEDILHVSSSFRYDLVTCYDMGIRNKVWVNRAHEPATPYEYAEIADTRGLPALVGL